MGKNLVQQRRGRGTSTFRVRSFAFPGKIEQPKIEGTAIVKDIIRSQGHTAPLMVVVQGNKEFLNAAPEGLRLGQEITIGKGAELNPGNTMQLGDIPEGTAVYNIEAKPGDGGKFARSGGSAARIVSKTADKVLIRLPSKKEKEFPKACLATIGIIAGGGRTEKPFLKAGRKYHRMKARNKYWPITSATSMNAVAHPFGGKGSHTKGRPHQAPRNAPPGRKAGKIAPRRTGRKQR